MNVYKFVFTMLLYAVSFLSVCAQEKESLFTITEIISEIANPRQIVAGDLSDNGMPDLAISAQRDGKSEILVFYQTERGWPQSPDKRIEPPRAWNMGVADLNSDGKNDLAVVAGNNYLYLYLGKEEFSVPHAFYCINQWRRSISIGNLHDDNHVDVLVGTARRRISPGLNVRCGYIRGPGRGAGDVAHIVDLNLDGIYDAAFICSSKYLRLYYGPFPRSIGASHKTVAEYVKLGPLPTSVNRIAHGDLNGNHRPDIAVAGSDAVHIYLQNMPIGFDEGSPPTLSLTNVGGVVHIADVNGDGIDNLCVMNRNKGLYVYQLTTDGTTNQMDVIFHWHDEKYEIRDFIIADIEDNGIADIVLLCTDKHDDEGRVLTFSNKVAMGTK